MTFLSKSSKLSTTCSAIALAFMLQTPAEAFDATGYFSDWEKRIEEKGNDVTIGSVSSNGSNGALLKDIEIRNIKDNSLTFIGSISLEGAVEFGKNGFSFKNMEAENVRIIGKDKKKKNQTNQVSIAAASGEDFSIVGEDERTHPFWPLNLGAAKFEDLQIKVSGKETIVFNIPAISLTGLKATEGKGFLLNSLDIEKSSFNASSSDTNYGKFSIGKTSIRELEHFGKIGLSVKSFSFGEIEGSGENEKQQKFDVAFKGATGQNIFVADGSDPNRPVYPQQDVKIDFGEFSFSIDSEKLINFAGLTGSSMFDNAKNKYSGSFLMSDLFVNVAKMPTTPKNKKGLDEFLALGYETLNIDYGGDVDWQVDTGQMDVKNILLTVDDIGKLAVSMKIDGYTEQFVRTMQTIQSRMQGNENKKEIQAASMEMLGLFSQLSLVDATVSTTNLSLANRLIESQAKKKGQDPEQMLTSLPFMAGALLPQIGLQNFAQAGTDAITNFLRVNGEVSVSISPEKPVPMMEFLQIQAAIKGQTMTPAELADRMNLKITSK